MATTFLALVFVFVFVLCESNPTAELTWGETESTQAKGNKTTPKESRCFALTSNDLFGGVWAFHHDFITESGLPSLSRRYFATNVVVNLF